MRFLGFQPSVIGVVFRAVGSSLLHSLLFFALAAGSVAQSTISLTQTPYAIQHGNARLLGRYEPGRMLRLVVALQPPHMEDEEQFLRELQDLNSPLFHKFLTEKEWNERFAPSLENEDAVATWLQGQGFTITQRFSNRLLIDVEASAAAIERAFNITINSYDVGGRTCFSNDRDPSIPSQFSGIIQTVLGLNNVEVAHSFSPKSRLAQHSPESDYSAGPPYAVGSSLQGNGSRTALDAASNYAYRSNPNGISSPYTPADIYSSSAYDYAALQNLQHCCNPLNNPNQSPPEASIAIAIWDDFSNADFAGFIASYPYLAYNVQRYSIDGQPQCCDLEVTLDVQWATATANSFGSASTTAKVHVYEGANNSFATLLDVLNRILADNKARVLSMSWGAAEIYGFSRPTINSYHAVFNQLAGQGWTLIAASGDGGATADCDDHLSVSYPASDPDVLSAGGTTMTFVWSQQEYESEVDWSGGGQSCMYNDGGGGGGCSAVFSAPGYQTTSACGSGSRSMPDVSLNADWWQTPQYVYFMGGLLWLGGGTSIVAPELAGFSAQQNAYLLYLQNIIGNTCGPSNSAHCAPMGNANTYIYAEGLNQPLAPHYPFYDIVTGCNGNDVTMQYGLTPYCATGGFDQATGWGSANMLQLAWTINSYLAGDFGAPEVSFSGPATNHWYNSDQTVSWTITDTSENGHRPNGIAGYSVFWDDDPGDVYGEATPGTGNSFYSGPQHANASSGSLQLALAGLGCHIVNVRAWDNAGQPSRDRTYGPLCYDTLPPVTMITLSGTMYQQYFQPQAQITLRAVDEIGGIAATYFQLDSGNWQTYSGPFAVSAPGPHTFSFYSVDLAGNSEAPQSTNFWVIGLTQTPITVMKTGSGTGTVTSTDGNIHCGSTCSYSYFVGLPVTLNPTPDPGSIFASWSGCYSTLEYSCTALVLPGATVTATFNQAIALQYVAIDPCRVVDTRGPNGQFGGPPLQGHSSRSFPLPQGPCPGIPGNAAAYALNITVVPRQRLGYLTAWPTGQPQPDVSTLNSYDGRVKAAAAIVPAGTSQAVSAYVTDTTDVIIDINGYFVPPNSSTLAYFALPNPCRLIDTRGPNGPLGGPALSGGLERDFPVLAGNCNIPASAQAYSFNVTAVPHTRLNYLTLWPYAQSRPTVSTLNAPTGTVTANAAIIKPGSQGEIAAYATQDTDLIVDVNGYFAPPDSGQNPWSLYALVPCRALDTRSTTGVFSGTITAPMSGSLCALTSSAHAYVLNATVLPQRSLGYLTLWPTGQTQPTTSTLNAYDGAVTSNMAIVLGGAGSVNAYASDLTNLILDISSYFGP